MSLQTPILFCVFNRPDLTRRVFDRIAQQKPAELLISCDGPRLESANDAELVNEVKQIVERVDWPCKVKTYFSESNQGCRLQMASAITWAFEQSERLIILEDDCLPDASFFGYCESLLDRYADDTRVMMISGDNFQNQSRTDASYYFSSYSHIWGWASWRRAWAQYDLRMSDWPMRRDDDFMKSFCTDQSEEDYWRAVFDDQHAGHIDTWDYSWAYACWANGGLTILPNANLVSNIGFREDATHTVDAEHLLAGKLTKAIGDLIHPDTVWRNETADAFTWQNIFQPAALARQQSASPTPEQRPRTGWRTWFSANSFFRKRAA